MAKRIASAQTTVGEFTRETEVQYTHVVVRRSTRAAAVLAQFEAGEYKGKRSGIDARWIKDRGFVVSWHNSEAAAKAASTKAYPYDSRAELVGVFAAGTKRDEPAAPAADADAGEWVPVSADEAATIAATEAAACAAAGPTALHALVADKAPAPAWPNRLFDQLSDPEVEAVAALVGVDTVGPSFRNYLRDTPALTGDDWTVGDAARAYLNTRLTYLTRDSVARHASDLIDQEREAARQ